MIDDASEPAALIDAAAGGFVVQHNSGNLIQGQTVTVYQALEAERRLPCSPIPASDLQRALYRYAPPPQFDAAAELLERTAGLVLAAEAGSGARTTALHLLAGLRDVAVHELEPDGDPRGQVDRLLSERAHAHLIELDTGADAGWHRFCREVLGRTAELRAQGSYFVATTSSSTWWAAPDAGLPVVRLDRPGARGVAVVHLRRADRVPWLDVPVVAGHLGEHTRPRDAARLATLIADAPDPEAAVQEFEGWRDHLRAWFEGGDGGPGHEDVTERALLVAAAVLNGFPQARVWDGANRLLRQLGAADEGPIPLSGPGLRTRVETLDARLAGAAVRLDWRRRSLDRAVLDYVWDEYPHMRRELLAWILVLPSDEPGRERLAAVVSGLAGRQEDTAFLAELVRAPRRLIAEVLNRSGRDPQIGRAVRRRLYEWATAAGTPPALAAGVADACGGELGRRYPRIALTRLRHLARHPDEAVTAATVRALSDLARAPGLPGLRGLVLEEIADWLRSADAQRRRTADLAVAAWLDAGDGAPLSEATIAVLGSAATHDRAAAAALFRTVRAWADRAADGEARRDRVAAMDALYEHVLQEERAW
ncbi:MAG TPA: hypothetical protein VOB72_25980 [Candidatus Dormibacteraeota bacterium]|nr:hypothetical protein [Candidatus Dormibacteraeota bacterium]